MNKPNEPSKPIWKEPPESGVPRTLTLLRPRETYWFPISGISWVHLRQVEERDLLALGFFDARVDISGRGLAELAKELATGQHVFVREQEDEGESLGDEEIWVLEIKVGPRRELNT